MSKNSEYQAKHKQKLKDMGLKVRSTGLSESNIEKINNFKKLKGITFDEALNELLK